MPIIKLLSKRYDCDVCPQEKEVRVPTNGEGNPIEMSNGLPLQIPPPTGWTVGNIIKDLILCPLCSEAFRQTAKDRVNEDREQRLADACN